MALVPTIDTDILQHQVFPVSPLTPRVMLPYACSSRIEDLSAFSSTLFFAYSHMCFLQSDLIRLLHVLEDVLLTSGCLTRHFQRLTRMILSPMFIKAGSCGEQCIAALLWTTDPFVMLRLGLFVYFSQMSLHFVFPHFRLKFISQILTTATMPQNCLRVMHFQMSLELFNRCKGGSFTFRMRGMHAAVLGFLFTATMNC